MQPQDRVRGERRPVTALFVDVVGSTSLAESLGPEDWATTMEHAVAVLTEAVERYDGWVASHTGDGFMALFGLPSAHDDDPARAVSSALEMVSGIDAAAGALRGRGVDFQIRVGINTGEVVVRDSTSGGQAQASRLYGDTLNVAARMQAEAPPGGIMITGETHAQVGGAVSTRHVGAMTVKGRSVPVEAYEVLGRSGSLRSVRGIAGLHSPMVGRDAELAQLTNALAPVRAGVARMALVVGEPGIGKSRLLAELHRVSEGEGLAWVEARTVSYGRNLPQHLAVDLVRALIGLPDPLESISADDASDRLSDCLRDLDGVDEAELGPILGHLLSFPLDADAAEQVAHMEPLTLRLRYTETISMLVRAMARSAASTSDDGTGTPSHTSWGVKSESTVAAPPTWSG